MSTKSLVCISHGCLFFSFYYRSIDFEAALSVEGVVDVVTAKDVPGRNTFGILTEDEELFATEKVTKLNTFLNSVDTYQIAFFAMSCAAMRLVVSVMYIFIVESCLSLVKYRINFPPCLLIFTQ